MPDPATSDPQRTIWKFPLDSPVVNLSMPSDAEIIDVRTQHGVPTMWVLLDPAEPMVTRTFVGVGTGFPIFDADLRYVGSAHDVEDMGLVFHIFERQA